MLVGVVHATAHEVVGLKPAGLPSELPRDSAADSFIRHLASQGFDNLRLVHRLDTPACGLLLAARSQAAAAHYSREIEARRWFKAYVTRVAAPLPAAQALIGAHKAYLKTDGPIARVVRAGGKPSFLDVVAAADAPGYPGQSHVLVRLHTGRFHQIRAMLAHLGAPLVGDTRYGGPFDLLYLEHVVLGAYLFADGAWTVWQAPAHPDRDDWAPALTAAVDGLAATARTTPPTPAPAP